MTMFRRKKKTQLILFIFLFFFLIFAFFHFTKMLKPNLCDVYLYFNELIVHTSVRRESWTKTSYEFYSNGFCLKWVNSSAAHYNRKRYMFLLLIFYFFFLSCSENDLQRKREVMDVRTKLDSNYRVGAAAVAIQCDFHFIFFFRFILRCTHTLTNLYDVLLRTN